MGQGMRKQEGAKGKATDWIRRCRHGERKHVFTQRVANLWSSLPEAVVPRGVRKRDGTISWSYDGCTDCHAWGCCYNGCQEDITVVGGRAPLGRPLLCSFWPPPE